MKNILILLFTISLAIYFSGCGEDVVNVPPGNQTPTISGKIENWYLGTNKKIFAIAHGGDTLARTLILDTCDVDSMGNFKMNIKIPPDSLLGLYKLQDSMCTHHTLVNPPNLKYCYIDLQLRDSGYNAMGQIFRSNDTSQMPATGKIFSYIFYFNGSGNITGTDTCRYGASITVYNYSITQTKNWNSIYTIFDTVVVNTVKARITTQPQIVQWYYQRY